MWTYILRRIFIAIPLIIGLATVTFFIIHLAPGDPMALYRNPEISPEVMELMRKNLGLDQPLHIQYVRSCRMLILKDRGGDHYTAWRRHL